MGERQKGRIDGLHDSMDRRVARCRSAVAFRRVAHRAMDGFTNWRGRSRAKPSMIADRCRPKVEGVPMRTQIVLLFVLLPVVSAFPVCQFRRQRFTMHHRFSLRFARFAVLCLLVVAVGFLPSDRAGAQSACAQLGVDCNLPAPPPVPPPTRYDPATGATVSCSYQAPSSTQGTSTPRTSTPRTPAPPEQRDPPE